MIKWVLFVWLLLASLILFLMMGIDKRKAVRHQWRISEKALFLIALLGGAVGGTAGMYHFRHKTKHILFQCGFPILAILQILLFCWVYWA
ncbi:MAG: DUF1294 domain-containing protein [Ruminococcus sp.]